MGLGKGHIKMIKDSLFLLSSNVLGRGQTLRVSQWLKTKLQSNFVISSLATSRPVESGERVWGRGRGALKMMKNSLFLLISNILERGYGGWCYTQYRV